MLSPDEEAHDAFYDCGDSARTVAARARQRLHARQFHLRAARDRAGAVRRRARQRPANGVATFESAKRLTTGQPLGRARAVLSLENVKNTPYFKDPHPHQPLSP